MSLRKFGENDVTYNTMKAHPRSEFLITDSRIYYNNQPQQSGAFTSNLLAGNNVYWSRLAGLAGNATLSFPGFINLYEYNVDKNDGYGGAPTNPYIYPYLTKDSARSSFKSATDISKTKYVTEFDFGDVLTASYPQYASIARDFAPYQAQESVTSAGYSWDSGYFKSLYNLYNLYGAVSEHYMVTSSYGDMKKKRLNLISIPSIFYGEKINPGSISLKWYFTGSLIGELRDEKQNGELIQVGPPGSTGSGSVAGVVFYNEGFISLTGSWRLSDTQIGLANRSAFAWSPPNGIDYPSWLYFAAGAQDDIRKFSSPGTPDAGYCATTFETASFGLSFEGVSKTQVITMYAHAKRGAANYSNNPTFLEFNQKAVTHTSSHVYEENPKRLIKNTVSSSYTNASGSFERQVYVSKVAIYDENKNLIGIASLANPVRKKETEEITFKIKLDI